MQITFLGTEFFPIIRSQYQLFFFLAMCGLHCCTGFSLVAVSRGCTVVAMCRLLVEVAPLIVERGLLSCGAGAPPIVERGLLSCGAGAPPIVERGLLSCGAGAPPIAERGLSSCGACA